MKGMEPHSAGLTKSHPCLTKNRATMPALQSQLRPDAQLNIWLARIDTRGASVAKWRRYLSNDETARASEFHFREHQNAYVFCRGLLRLIVATHIALPPEEVQFGYLPFGKPVVESDPGLHINIAHSGSLFACATTRLGPVGIDVELIRRLDDWSSIAERYFAAEELTELRGSRDPHHAFYSYWTAKEAFLKATGEGLRRDLRSFATSISNVSRERLVRIDQPYEDVSKWTLRTFSTPPGYKGALALRKPLDVLRVTTLSASCLERLTSVYSNRPAFAPVAYP